MKKYLVVLALFLFSSSGYALNCSADDNNDIFTPGEIVPCEGTQGTLCPINKTPCVDKNTRKGTCGRRGWLFGSRPWFCLGTGSFFLEPYPNEAACRADCESGTVVETCPLGEQFACQSVPGLEQKYCSNRVCTDIAAPIKTEETFNSNWHQNDGDLNNCLGQIYVFSGRPMECKRPGVKSAWKNCCKNQGDAIYFDSQGSSVESTLTNKALLATLQAAGAAIQAANAAIQAGASAAQASQAGANAATNSLQGAFDPTSLAIAIAVALIMDFIANACDQMDMETGMLSASGFCVETGEYCAEKWKYIGCVQKNKTFCCFNSKLARIFHEQGRRQLKSFTGNNGFGTPNAPNCRGFTPEEFQSLDFSKIDLTEYVGELQLRSTAVIGNQVEQKANEYIDKTDPN